MPISHLGITVLEINKARSFYLAALAPLEYQQRFSLRDRKELGFGVSQAPDFWLGGQNPSPKRPPSTPLMDLVVVNIYISLSRLRIVNKAAGGKDNGVPGLRPLYFKWYYGAFVYDLEGRNIEAACLKPAFLAEPWGIAEWGIVGAVLSGAVGGVATRLNWI